MKTFSISSEAQLAEVARQIIEQMVWAQVVCFYGEMGAGKTTLIKVIGDQLSVQDKMSSPTFSIVNEYRTAADEPIYHFDFYRIESLSEARDIGAEEYFYSGEISLIEWPEHVEELLPPKHLKISINLVGEKAREISITKHGR